MQSKILPAMSKRQETDPATGQAGSIPWTLKQYPAGMIEILEDNRVVVFWPNAIHRPERAKSNLAKAEKIVHEHNCHDDLLQFAEDMIQYLELKLIGFRQDYPEDHAIVQTALRYHAQACALVAKAQRGPHD